jgi:hypothetical protein
VQSYFAANNIVRPDGRPGIELLSIQYRMHPDISRFPSRHVPPDPTRGPPMQMQMRRHPLTHTQLLLCGAAV